MSGNPNLDALYSIQIKFDNLKKDIDARTKLMQDINNKICNAYLLLPYNLEAIYPTSDNLDRYLPRKIETELEQMQLLCLRLESESMTKNFTTEIHRILLYLESCRKSTDWLEIKKDMKMIEYYAKELKTYTSAITVEHLWFQTEIKQASLLFPNGLHIDDIMKDLNNKLPEDFDKHLKNILLKSGYFSEPDKSSHIESAIAAILLELKEFRESADNLVQSQNMYCVNISTSHGPGNYFKMKDDVSAKTMHQNFKTFLPSHEPIAIFSKNVCSQNTCSSGGGERKARGKAQTVCKANSIKEARRQ